LFFCFFFGFLFSCFKVYDATHLGHARCYVQVDIIQRLMEDLFGYNIQHVMGITDVDDKIIQRAAELQQTPSQLALEMEEEFSEAMTKLGVRPPVMKTRVTEHIEDVQQYIQTIWESGCAYKTDDGVYFDVSKLAEDYFVLGGKGGGGGGLAGDISKHGKRNAEDFALWKFRQEGEEAIGWESRWGFGRPGWHIECSTFIEKAFEDKRIDVHSGGIDLGFPHHNNEIAQSCARYGCGKEDLFGAFVHVGHLHIDGQKMSKSLKNFTPVRELPGSPDAFRMLCLLHHYKKNTNYSALKLEEATHVLDKLNRFVADFRAEEKLTEEADSLRWTDADRQMFHRVNNVKSEMYHLLAEDMQTPEVVHALLHMISDLHKYTGERRTARNNLIVRQGVDMVEKFLVASGMAGSPSTEKGRAVASEQQGDEEEEALVDALVYLRKEVKKMSMGLAGKEKGVGFGLADYIRDDVLLKQRGISVKDLKNGESTWKYLKD
jgi:cysteinyl-tRNA synthetase